MITEAQKERFARLCEEEAENPSAPRGIGTYGEKRLHRILKRYFSETEEQTEVAVGPYVADVKIGNRIVEIQTGSLRPLAEKLRYYLDKTECHVTVACPILAKHLLIRMDRETGEVLHKRRSSRPGRPTDLLPELYWLRDLLPNERLTLLILSVGAEEFRYSERVRYRREGAYEAELFPRELLEDYAMTERGEYEIYLPEAESFTAAEYASCVRLRGRQANFGLQALCAMELLERELVGRKYLYRRKEKDTLA